MKYDFRYVNGRSILEFNINNANITVYKDNDEYLCLECLNFIIKIKKDLVFIYKVINNDTKLFIKLTNNFQSELYDSVPEGFKYIESTNSISPHITSLK